MKNLQNLIKLNELAENIYANGRRVAIVLEGRDGAGKSGTVRELTRYLPPYTYRVQPSFMPTKRMMKSWLPEWSKLLPQEGQLVIYDRSWYSRALLQPVMGWCSNRQYKNFMRDVIQWEDHQIGLEIIKIWLSVDETKQRELLARRVDDPLRYWKYSANDPKSLENFDAITEKKDAMFELDDWIVVDMMNKNVGRDKTIDWIVSLI
jgi:polyphosphate kinase 2 (PPK2 family)